MSRKMSAAGSSGTKESVPRDALAPIHVAAYSVGHCFNDLTDGMGFTYFSWYLINIVGLSGSTAGLCMLSGQFGNAFSTPVAGLVCDKFNTRCGKKFPWYVFGTLVVAPCFSAMFLFPSFVNGPVSKGSPPSAAFQKAWYIIQPAVYNAGFAFV